MRWRSSCRAHADAAGLGEPLSLVRAGGMEGLVRSKLGQHDEGRRLTRQALSLALEHDLHAAVPEAYNRLAVVLAHDTDYVGARAAYAEAYAFCGQRGLDGDAQVCLACLATVLRQTGEYEQALQACAAVTADAPFEAVVTAGANAAAVHILRGETRLGRPVLERFLAIAAELPLTDIEGQWFLALADDADGAGESALARAEAIVRRLPEADDRHYILPVLCWIASLACAGAVPTRFGPAPRRWRSAPRRPARRRRSRPWRTPSGRWPCWRASRRWPSCTSTPRWSAWPRSSCRGSARTRACEPAWPTPRRATRSARAAAWPTPWR